MTSRGAVLILFSEHQQYAMQFVTEKEVEEVKEKRQKEWEKVRRPDQPLERPEEPIDNRTLYEKLKSQRDKKQEEFEEQFKFKNMIYKGLDDDEAVFLQLIADKQAKQAAETRNQEKEELQAYRDAVEKLREDSESIPPLAGSSSTSTPSTTVAVTSSHSLASPTAIPKTHKSQLSLIAGSIKTKRKRSSTNDDDSESKISPSKKTKLTSPTTTTVPSTSMATTSSSSSSNALSGLAAYSSDNDSDDEPSPDD